MRKIVAMAIGLVVFSAAAVFASCGSCCGGDKPVADGAKKSCCKAADVYICTMCKLGAQEAGKCAKCGMDLVKMHVLTCADGTASLCACSSDCKCTIKDDGAKCSCGKDVLKIPVKDISGCGACKKAAPAPAPAPAK